METINYAYNLGRAESFIRILLGDFGRPSDDDRSRARAFLEEMDAATKRVLAG